MIEVDTIKLNNLLDKIKEDVMLSIKYNKKSIIIDYEKIKSVDFKLAEELLDNPEDVLSLLERFINEKFKFKEPLKVRVKNLPESNKVKRIRDIRSYHAGKLIEVEGIIKISSEVRPVVVEVEYKHDAEFCSGTFWYPVDGFTIKKPDICPKCKKTGGKFVIINKKTIDMQRLLIEEPPEHIERGEQPGKIIVFLKEDLCEPKMERRTIPGARIKVVGILKTLQNGKTNAVMDYYMEAVYIEPVEKEIEDIELTEEDIKKIKEFSSSENAIDLLVNSIAPFVYGEQYKMIKKALLLQLIGGVTKKKEGGAKIRGNIHILLVGDPGMAKSQLLIFISNIAPKAKYVAGTGVTGAGLTAVVKKDEFLKGGWALEAGALVLASGGIVCIDELDKIKDEDLLKLHEAMEQQTITIDKANIHVTLKTETSVLAAANPKYGRWDRMKNIIDQINLPPTILNRFDLIFVLIDIPDKDKDRQIARSVLKGLVEKEEAEVPTDFLQKYIIYAKKIVPKWTERAWQKIEEFFVDIRHKYYSSENPIIPITNRQLESLVRLAEAHARLRLSDKVTEEDAEEAINLLMHSLEMVALDPETKKIDIDIIQTGMSSTQRSRISIILSIIEDLQKFYPEGVPIQEVIKEAKEKKIPEDKVKEVINKMIANGELYEPKQNHVKIIGK